MTGCRLPLLAGPPAERPAGLPRRLPGLSPGHVPRHSVEGRYDEAVAERPEALELGNGAGLNLVDILYRQGKRAEALAALREFYTGDQELLDAVDQGYAEGGYPGGTQRRSRHVGMRE